MQACVGDRSTRPASYGLPGLPGRQARWHCPGLREEVRMFLRLLLPPHCASSDCKRLGKRWPYSHGQQSSRTESQGAGRGCLMPTDVGVNPKCSAEFISQDRK